MYGVSYGFPMEIQKVISDYCNNHLPEEKWYENEFDFIQDEDLTSGTPASSV